MGVDVSAHLNTRYQRGNPASTSREVGPDVALNGRWNTDEAMEDGGGKSDSGLAHACSDSTAPRCSRIRSARTRENPGTRLMSSTSAS